MELKYVILLSLFTFIISPHELLLNFIFLYQGIYSSHSFIYLITQAKEKGSVLEYTALKNSLYVYIVLFIFYFCFKDSKRRFNLGQDRTVECNRNNVFMGIET